MFDRDEPVDPGLEDRIRRTLGAVAATSNRHSDQLETLAVPRTEVTLIDVAATPTTPGSRRPRIGALVAAAAVVLIVFGALVLAEPDEADTRVDLAAAPSSLIAFVGDFEVIDGDRGPRMDYLGDFLSDIFVVNEDGSGLRNLTNTPDVNESAPTWSPDGTRLAFLRDLRVGSARLVVFDTTTQTETADVPVPVGTLSDTAGEISWSADGEAIRIHITKLAAVADRPRDRVMAELPVDRVAARLGLFPELRPVLQRSRPPAGGRP
jgi:hypothetical protein